MILKIVPNESYGIITIPPRIKMYLPSLVQTTANLYSVAITEHMITADFSRERQTLYIKINTLVMRMSYFI